jgi:hypothetical protein
MSRLWLKAYAVGATDGWSIEPASSKREWMDATYKKIAYRCLPLIVANQAGWVVRCPANFTATWSGKIDNHGVRIDYAPDSTHRTGVALSHFGSGVLTFLLPWLFRTPPGIGLCIRGLPNDVRDNAVPLDGIVETDWSPFTFTVNWKLQRPDVPVHFRVGDPVCLIQPFALALLEQFDCSFESYDTAPVEIQQGLYDFVNTRTAKNAVAQQSEYETQRDYFSGRFPDGTPAHYPLGKAAPEPFATCPVRHHDVPAAAGVVALAPDAVPTPRHRTNFDLKPFSK